MKRLLIFSHYNPHDQLSDYVLNWLQQIYPLFSRILFVSNSKLNKDDHHKVAAFADKLITRENRGFDFGAWKEAMTTEGQGELANYYSVTLINDSCFGPLFPMEDVYNKMEARPIDFWGITKHKYQEPDRFLLNKPIPEHIQSYFMVFNRRVVASSAFKGFWRKVNHHTTKRKLVQDYELKLTSHLATSGFRYGTVTDEIECPTIEPNLTIFYPDLLINQQSPFLKIKSFFHTTHPAYLKKLVSERSRFNVNLIDTHFNHHLPPDKSINITDNQLLVHHGRRASKKNNLKIGIHFHVYYLDVFLKHLPAFQNTGCSFDLFITTDTEEKKARIAALFDPGSTSPALKEIRVCENIGRDVLPWLRISENLARYDVAGHFHTKKSEGTYGWIGATWMDEMVDTLIKPMNEITDAFDKDRKLGIIIPDMPVFFKKTSVVPGWNNTKDIAVSLWDTMSLQKKMSFDNVQSSIMPYGSMCWYRPEAIKPLLSLELAENDFHEEPLPKGGTLAHAIESLPVFVAWGQGYTYKVAMHPDYLFSGFNSSALTHLVENKNRLYRSATWRTGRVFTYLPGKLLDWVFRR